MEFFVTTPDIINNTDVHRFFEKLKIIAKDREGYCYYKYPIAGGIDQHLPDLVIVDKEYGIVSIDIYDFTIDIINDINDDKWVIGNADSDSLILKLDDYKENLNSKFQKYRDLRGKVAINTALIFSNIQEEDFNKKFPKISTNNILFNNFLNIEYEILWEKKSKMDLEARELFLSVAQGSGPLNSIKKSSKNLKSDKIGIAIKFIDSKLASLDRIQHEAAIQFADGPQSIRGMAGTGKTIILTMRAAILHSRYPERKILYTFHTQSLYNQIKNLITKFYRESEPKDPNWDNLLILHSWGGVSKEGVYYRTCLRNSLKPFNFQEAKNSDDSFEYVCSKIADDPLREEFDYILMDEAQDLPMSFYKIIYKICKSPKRITFAYDELQNLNEIKQKDFSPLFGYKSKEEFKENYIEYPENIKKEYILEKSYRNPLNILMTAHGVGMGIHNKNKEMQLIEEKDTWEAIGYKFIKGELKKGSEVEIIRPKENSISIVSEIYSGKTQNLIIKKFDNRIKEVEWIAELIEDDIKNESVMPHDIFVITLDTSRMKELYLELQRNLFSKGIPSLIPGIDVGRDKFAEYGYVTLSTVYKAKGNEAYIVYIMNFEKLYDYVDFVNSRNKAFTSISRSKGWCRISGTGVNMERAIEEIELIVTDIPFFKFTYPDPEMIRRSLSKEERAKEVRNVEKLANELLKKDKGAINSLSEETKAQLSILFK